MKCSASIHITPSEVWLNGERLPIAQPVPEASPDATVPSVANVTTGKSLLTVLYKQHVGDYPKFYKMDPLARLGFIAAELLLQSIEEEHFVDREDRAIVLVNRSASLAADRKYEETIQTGENYFPSPADFVYTLPNIVTGEITIRHHYHGETTFLVIDQKDATTLSLLIGQALQDSMTTSVLGGWLECVDENDFEAELSLYERD